MRVPVCCYNCARQKWNNKKEGEKQEQNSTKHDQEMRQWQITHSMKAECNKLRFNTCDIFMNSKVIHQSFFAIFMWKKSLGCGLYWTSQCNRNKTIIMKNLSSYNNYMLYVKKLSLILATWPQNKAQWLVACGHVSAGGQSLRFIWVWDCPRGINLCCAQ